MTTETAAPSAEGTTTPASESLLSQPDTGKTAPDSNAPAPAPAAEAKPAGEQGTEANGKAGDEPTVPDAYDLKMPEGVELDKAAADEFGTIAKELKLSQVDAQRIADVAVKMQQKQAETHAEMVKGWVDQCKTDKEFGGDNLEQNLGVARKAIEAFGSPELKSLLNNTGIGNHPELVRFAYKAGKAISEDTFVASGSRAPTPETTLEKRLYPNMN
jgi:hypothetical protein